MRLANAFKGGYRNASFHHFYGYENNLPIIVYDKDKTDLPIESPIEVIEFLYTSDPGTKLYFEGFGDAIRHKDGEHLNQGDIGYIVATFLRKTDVNLPSFIKEDSVTAIQAGALRLQSFGNSVVIVPLVLGYDIIGLFGTAPDEYYTVIERSNQPNINTGIAVSVPETEAPFLERTNTNTNTNTNNNNNNNSSSSSNNNNHYVIMGALKQLPVANCFRGALSGWEWSPPSSQCNGSTQETFFSLVLSRGMGEWISIEVPI